MPAIGEVTTQEIGNSLVLTVWLSENSHAQVHMDKRWGMVVRSEVTFWILTEPFDGGVCPAQVGDDWEAGVKRVKWWLSGNVKYRANTVLPKHGYSAMYCTNLPGCNCEEHKGASVNA
ncbi:hypothetical protein [Streptomyces sp. EKS3.2]|uniref:hypothetical protein n=1 Tax=Streptomyces sp. EKS3.2 TaxID=3461008 RepID=UPI00404293CE